MTPHERSCWLEFHIPSRFRAAMAHTEFQPEPDRKPLDGFSCFAVTMGRLIALRWLVEFVGIKQQKGQPVVCSPKLKSYDKWIRDLNGTPIDPSSPEGHILGGIWDGICKAIGHVTDKSNHHPLEVSDLAPATEILLTYIDRELYFPQHDSLRSAIERMKC